MYNSKTPSGEPWQNLGGRGRGWKESMGVPPPSSILCVTVLCNNYSLYAAEEDHTAVYQELIDIKSKCLQLGMELGLPPSLLFDTLLKTFHQDKDQAFSKVLLTWLRQEYNIERFGPPTWRRLVEAVDSPTGGNNSGLAKTIASRHPMAGMITILSCVCL